MFVIFVCIQEHGDRWKRRKAISGRNNSKDSKFLGKVTKKGNGDRT